MPRKWKRSDEDSESESEQEDLYNQFDHYLRMKRDRDITDHLLWWRTTGITLFPKMAVWVRDTFAISATGCGVEREFSIAG